MMARIKAGAVGPTAKRPQELTAEASDAVLLGFAVPEAKALGPEAKAEALKWLGGGVALGAPRFDEAMAASAVRSRLQGRRQNKADGARGV